MATIEAVAADGARLLVRLNRVTGYVYDARREVRWPAMPMSHLLGFEGWQPHPGTPEQQAALVLNSAEADELPMPAWGI